MRKTLIAVICCAAMLCLVSSVSAQSGVALGAWEQVKTLLAALGDMAYEAPTDYVATSALELRLGDFTETTALGSMATEESTDYVATDTFNTALADYTLTTGLGDMAFEAKTDYVATTTFNTALDEKMNFDASNASDPLTLPELVLSDGVTLNSVRITEWPGGGGGTPGGAEGQIQFNTDSAFAGDSDLTWASGTKTLTTVNASFTGDVGIGGDLDVTGDIIDPTLLNATATGTFKIPLTAPASPEDGMIWFESE